MAYSRARTTVSGRHSRPPGIEEVRRTCLAVLTMLIAQYALGIFLNLFVTVPASDKHAGLLGVFTSGPFALTVHAVLGLSLLGTALLLLVRVVRVEEPVLIALATGALGAIGGAFAAGEIFVKDGGQDSASFTMALLAGVAMLCYVGMLALVSAPQRRRAHARGPQPAAHSYARPVSGLLADPAPDPEPEWADDGWTDSGWTDNGWPEDPWAEPAWSENNQPPPLPMRHRPEAPTAIGVTWEAPWSQREWP
jgi:hypothetical protein